MSATKTIYSALKQGKPKGYTRRALAKCLANSEKIDCFVKRPEQEKAIIIEAQTAS